MMIASARRMVLLCLLLVKFHLSTAQTVPVPNNVRPRPLYNTFDDGQISLGEQCVNLASWNRVGPFRSERKLVKYGDSDTSISVSVPNKMLDSTRFPEAFRTRRVGGRIAFSIRPVYPASALMFSISLGFAQFVKCSPGMRLLTVTVGQSKEMELDVFKEVGCGQALYLNFSDMVADKSGVINIVVKKKKGAAHISVMCIRHVRLITILPSTTSSISPSAAPSSSAAVSSTPSQTFLSPIPATLSSSPSKSVFTSISSLVSISPSPALSVTSSLSPLASPISTPSMTPSTTKHSPRISISSSATSSPTISASFSESSRVSPSIEINISNSPTSSIQILLPSATLTPSNSADATPTPTVSLSPEQSISVLLTPSMSPSSQPAFSTQSPSLSSTVDATTFSLSPSSSFIASVSPSPSFDGPLLTRGCTTRRCISWIGRGNYEVVGNSMSYSNSLTRCLLRSSSQAKLTVPSNATVRLAFLVWSASGGSPFQPRVRLNDVLVYASDTESAIADGVEFYRSSAEVTKLVSSSGTYRIDGLYPESVFEGCRKNFLYATWALVVVYENTALPSARIVYCFPRLIFTAPSGIYDFEVPCLGSSSQGKSGKVTVVAFDGDQEGEYFYINNFYLGYNLFNGSTAPKLDILTFDTSFLLQTNEQYIRLRFWTYYTPKLFGATVEGLIIPLYIAYSEM